MGKYNRLILVMVLLIFLLVLAEITGLREHFSLNLVRAKFADNLYTGLIIFIILFAIGNLIHIPGLVFLFAAVFALGQVTGGVITYVAACISCAFTFSIVNYLGKDALHQFNHRIAVKLLSHLNEFPVRNIVILRTLFQSNPLLNYTLAMSGVSFRHYMLGTLIGLPVPLALYCIFFAQIAKAMHLN